VPPFSCPAHTPNAAYVCGSRPSQVHTTDKSRVLLPDAQSHNVGVSPEQLRTYSITQGRSQTPNVCPTTTSQHADTYLLIGHGSCPSDWEGTPRQLAPHTSPAPHGTLAMVRRLTCSLLPVSSAQSQPEMPLSAPFTSGSHEYQDTCEVEYLLYKSDPKPTNIRLAEPITPSNPRTQIITNILDTYSRLRIM